MEQHKHCGKCGETIVPPRSDEELSDLSPMDTMVFHKEVCYSNGFCSSCVLEYSLSRLILWFYRGDKI